MMPGAETAMRQIPIPVLLGAALLAAVPAAAACLDEVEQLALRYDLTPDRPRVAALPTPDGTAPSPESPPPAPGAAPPRMAADAPPGPTAPEAAAPAGPAQGAGTLTATEKLKLGGLLEAARAAAALGDGARCQANLDEARRIARR